MTARFPGNAGLNGFFIQQASPDSVPTGVFVYTPEHSASQLPESGDRVRVRGRAGSHRGTPQLEWVEAINICARAEPEPEPVPLSPPVSADRLRALSGVLVETRDALVVTGNHRLRQWGVLHLARGDRRFHPATAVRGGRDARLLLDDGSYQRGPEPIPYVDQTAGRRVGSRLTPTEAILVKRFGDWRLHPVGTPEFAETNPRRPPPRAPADAFRLATLNLHNYFPVTGARGPRDPARRRRREAAVIEALSQLRADVLVVQELANNRKAAATLRRRLNQATGANYRFANGPEPIGSDAIRVALLVRRDRAELRTASVLQGESHLRPPVRARLGVASGRAIDVVGVHFKSRGGCQGHAPCGRRQRREQATSLASSVRGSSGVPTFVLGDFNSYVSEEPMRILGRAGLQPSVAPRVAPDERYTYVHETRSGMLDFALADERGRAAPHQGTIWHLGADELSGAAGNGPWGASDHDAVILDLLPSATDR